MMAVLTLYISKTKAINRPRKVVVDLHGLPVQGMIDSGGDITIINGDVLYH